ncbi:MAG: STAS domain-containing protein [Tepidisphaeraceae bacterium]
MADLQVTSEQVDGTLVVRLTGEPNINAVAPMRELVVTTAKSGPQKVVIDLSGLEYVSSLVAGRLVELQTYLKREGGRAVIAGPNALVKDAPTRMRVPTLIPNFDTVEQAMAH